MKKVSTVAAKPSQKISRQKLTVGLDLGDRNSWYCVLDESGQIQLEQRVRTKALREVFGEMPHSRFAGSKSAIATLPQAHWIGVEIRRNTVTTNSRLGPTRE